MQYAIETLQIELYLIRGLLRKILENEHHIMGSIEHDHYIDKENILVKAIDYLESADGGE